MRYAFVAIALICATPALAAYSDDPGKGVPLEIATQMAKAAFDACRAKGYNVSVYVLDAAYDPIVVMRDGSARHAIDGARRKAYTAIKSGMVTSAFAAKVGGEWRPAPPPPGQKMDFSVRPPGVNGDDDLFAAGGGVPVIVHGEVVAGVGVSGAPGGDKDEACANAGLAAAKGKY